MTSIILWLALAQPTELQKNVHKKCLKKQKISKKAIQHEFVLIHWAEKLWQERGDFTPMEYIADLPCHYSGTKLLGTTSWERRTGRDQAEAIKHILKAWNLKAQFVTMWFDTTASYTGKFNSVCILLEALLDHPLLWTTCCHHVHEVILAHVFKCLFGNSCSPQITIFEPLKRKWLSLDFAAVTTQINSSFF